MNGQEFFEGVVLPNEAEFQANPIDIRLAVNAILTLNALFGIVAVERGLEDATFKKELAADHEPWKLTLDLGDALKHGKLTRGLPRLITSPSALGAAETEWSDEGTWDDAEVWVDTALFVDLGTQRVRANKLVRSVTEFGSVVVSGRTSPPVLIASLITGLLR